MIYRKKKHIAYDEFFIQGYIGGGVLLHLISDVYFFP